MTLTAPHERELHAIERHPVTIAAVVGSGVGFVGVG